MASSPRLATEEEKEAANPALESPILQPEGQEGDDVSEPCPPDIKAPLLDFHEHYQLPKALSALICNGVPQPVMCQTWRVEEVGLFLISRSFYCLQILLLRVFCPLIN